MSKFPMRIILVFLALVQLAFGANHYIRAGASGTNSGASWANAFPTFAAAAVAGYVRGDTYYIAGGTYSEAVTVNVAASGSTWVYFKKANTADNGSDPGWNASYASTAATITISTNGPVLDIAQPYISFNGVSGSGSSGHGIRFVSTSTADNSYCVQIESGVSNVTLTHCELSGSGFSASAFSTMGLFINTFANVKGINVSYCWIHDCSTNGVLATALVGTSYSDYGLLFENNLLSETGGCTNVSNHGQGMQLGAASEFAFTIIRNNQFRNVVGSAMISFLTSANNANHHDNLVYNNIFYFTDTVKYAGLSPGPIWHEAPKSYTGIVNSRLYIYNNVFYNISGSGSLAQIIIETITSDVQLKNNIWENSTFTSTHSAGLTQSNNGYYNNTNAPAGTTNQVNGTSTAFVSSASSGNFLPVTGGYAVGAGLNLAVSFTKDAAGADRMVPWSLGAYNYNGGSDILTGRLPPAGTWQAAGVPGGIPTNRTTIVDVTKAPYNVDNTGVASAVAGINSAITAASANTVVYLPAGRYNVDGQITMQRDNVTLRGHGMDTILAASGSSPTIYAGHSSSWQNNNQAITGGDYPVGSSTFSVASTTGFTVGQMVRVWQQNDQNANAPVIDVNGSDLMQAQITVLTAKTSNTLTVSPAIVFPLKASLNPEIYYNSTSQTGLGVEDLYIDASAKTGNYTIELNCTKNSWIKNVRSYKSNGYHFYVNYAVQCEIRHSYLDDLQTPQNNNAGIKFDTVGSSLIIDNIFYRQFPAVQINGQPVSARGNNYVGGGSAGNVIAYNYAVDSPNVQGSGLMGYAYVSDHGAHNTFNLYEGNVGCKFVQDGWYGSDTGDTVVRNWFLGTDPESNNLGECVVLNRFTRNASVVGNLLGTVGYTFTYDALEANNPGNTTRYIYRLGYPAAGNRVYTGGAVQPSVGTWWSSYGSGVGTNGFQELDRDVNATLLRKGNYNTQDAAIPASESLGTYTISPSYFLTAKPTFFGTLAWPAFDPANPNMTPLAIPAGYRYTYGIDPPTGSTVRTRRILTGF